MRYHLPSALVLMALAAWTRHPTGRPEVQGPGPGDVEPAETAPGGGGAGDAGGAGSTGSEGAAMAAQPCADQHGCYPEGFCASDETCHSVQPGAPGNTCEHAALAAAQDTSGPVIFGIGQDVIGTDGDLCRKDRNCLNNGSVCQFSFQAFDPDADLAADDDAYPTLRFIGDDGTEIEVFQVRAPEGSSYSIQGCWAETLTTFTGAVLMHDLAGHSSNALCFEGSAP